MERPKFTENDLCNLFVTGQYGRFYVVSNWDGSPRFRVQLLPKGEAAKPNGKPNLCLNSDAVLVYGHVSNDGGKKECGWIHDGRWVDDFLDMAKSKRQALDFEHVSANLARKEKEAAEEKRITELLLRY